MQIERPREGTLDFNGILEELARHREAENRFRMISDPNARGETIRKLATGYNKLSSHAQRDQGLMDDLVAFAAAQLASDSELTQDKPETRSLNSQANTSALMLLENVGTAKTGIELAKVIQNSLQFSEDTRGTALEMGNNVQEKLLFNRQFRSLPH